MGAADTSYWGTITPANAQTEEETNAWVNALATRSVWQFRDAMPIITVDVEIKDSGILTGDHVRLSTAELQDTAGNDLDRAFFQSVRREKKGNKITLKCLRITTKKIAYFTPIDAPDYDVATEAQRLAYGYFTDADGKISGDDGYSFW